MKVSVSPVYLEPLPFDPSWGFWRRLIEPKRFRVVNTIHLNIGEQDHLHRMIIPSGLVTDMASLPKFLKPFSPDSINSGTAALVHDSLYKSGEVGKVVADALLKGLILDLGEGNAVQAELVFLGVHLFGHFAWNKHRRNTPAVETKPPL